MFYLLRLGIAMLSIQGPSLLDLVSKQQSKKGFQILSTSCSLVRMLTITAFQVIL